MYIHMYLCVCVCACEKKCLFKDLLFLAEHPEDISLSDVFIFITGGDTVPVFGFKKKPIIEFYSERGRLPSVATCTLSLRLPRNLVDYADFKEIIKETILGSAGFGNV